MNRRIYSAISVAALAVANTAWAGSPETVVAVVPSFTAPIVASNFDGFYVGASASSTSGTLEATDDFFGDTVSNDISGIGGDIHVGYNFARSTSGLFFGGELAYGVPGATDAADTISLDSLMSASARVGYVADKLMYFGKAGFANGSLDCDYCANTSVNGFVIGAGVEYLISDNISVRGQYEHFDLQGSGDDGLYAIDTNLNANVLSIGLNYHF